MPNPTPTVTLQAPAIWPFSGPAIPGSLMPSGTTYQAYPNYTGVFVVNRVDALTLFELGFDPINLGVVANVVTDYGADPTGSRDSTQAIRNAVAVAINNADPVFQTKKVYIPPGIYLVSGTIPITNGGWIQGGGASSDAINAGGTLIRCTAAGASAGDVFQFRGFGQLKISDLTMDTTDYATGGASYARKHAGGSGYAVNDTITLAGGAFTTATVLKVTAVSAGAVTGVVIQTPGVYSVAPSPVVAVSQGSTSGSGTNATFDMVYANAAAISISGPTTKLTVDAASGATSLTVDSIVGFANGDAIYIEQDDGTYESTTINGIPSGNTIHLASGLSFKASANHPVYDRYAYLPLIENVACRGYWDCIRIENAGNVTVRGFWAQDFGHDAIIKTSGAQPDNGQDRYELTAWDLNRGTSQAGFEFLSGGDIRFAATKLIGSANGILVNSFFSPTGTLLATGTSFEELRDCGVRLHQSVAGVTYANVAIIGNEFLQSGAAARDFCIDVGSAAGWISNIVFMGNVSTSYPNTAVSLIDVQDGDGVVIAGNRANNGNSNAHFISVGTNATNVIESGNNCAGFFPSGKYGTMLSSSLAQWFTDGDAGVGGAFVVNGVVTGGASNAYSISLNGSGSYPSLDAESGATGLVIRPNADGSKAALRLDPLSSSALRVSAIDATGVSAYETLALNGTQLNFQIGGVDTGIVTAGGLNNMVVGATTAVAGTFTTLRSLGHVLRSVGNTLTAIGTNRATALLLAADINNVTAAATGTGVQLPVGVVGMEIDIYADSGIVAAAIQVYAAGSETIDTVSGATGVPLTKAKRCRFTFVNTNTWISAQLGAVSA
jgi:hypothetical protein